MAESSEKQSTHPGTRQETNNETDPDNAESVDKSMDSLNLKEGGLSGDEDEGNKQEAVAKGGTRKNLSEKKKVQSPNNSISKGETNKKADGKSYYDNSCKHGALCIVQDNDKDFIEGNQKDANVLFEFFKNTLGFSVKTYNSFGELDLNLEEDLNLSSTQYYCLMICISGHGGEYGIQIENQEKKTIHELKERFGNDKIQKLAGVPKIVLLDTCRGEKSNKSANNSLESIAKGGGRKNDSVLPTTDSDFLLIHATTHGNKAFMPPAVDGFGSVGIQGVMKTFKENWKKDHLEEMLIDAREEVAKFKGTHEDKNVRQTLETQSTLTKRLMFVKK